MSLIELENVTKVYRTGEASVKALKGISLQLEKQTFVSFIGPSGSRKSTLLNLIGVLDRPTRGTIRVNGTEQIGSQRAFSKHFERVQRYGSFCQRIPGSATHTKPRLLSTFRPHFKKSDRSV
jgi:ABC-type lipoprotein export system ATPase subunit